MTFETRARRYRFAGRPRTEWRLILSMGLSG